MCFLRRTYTFSTICILPLWEIDKKKATSCDYFFFGILFYFLFCTLYPNTYISSLLLNTLRARNPRRWVGRTGVNSLESNVHARIRRSRSRPGSPPPPIHVANRPTVVRPAHNLSTPTPLTHPFHIQPPTRPTAHPPALTRLSASVVAPLFEDIILIHYIPAAPANDGPNSTFR